MTAHKKWQAYQTRRKRILQAMQTEITRHDGGAPWRMTKNQMEGIQLRVDALRKKLDDLDTNYYRLGKAGPMATLEQAERMLRKHHGYNYSYHHLKQVATLARVLKEHPTARLERCSDESTGCRYGKAACRRGKAEKIGHSTYKYQLWAVWN